jgi:hypothetical protein
MNDTLATLFDATIQNIRTVLNRFGHPAVMTSFGKDSMVLLHILREAGFDLPCIYLRDPWQSHKHAFAEERIRAMGLTVHNWPPNGMGTKFNGENFEFVARYNIAPDAFLDIPKNVEKQRPRAKLLCGLFDIIRRPLSVISHGWDVLLLGHRDCDTDPYYGQVPLHVDLKMNAPGEPAAYFPLRQWTDEDIWDFIESEHIPVQLDRYKDRGELSDKSFNNDYVQCCSKCLDPREGPVVFCPKFGKDVNSVADKVPKFDAVPDYFGKGDPQ